MGDRFDAMDRAEQQRGDHDAQRKSGDRDGGYGEHAEPEAPPTVSSLAVTSSWPPARVRSAGGRWMETTGASIIAGLLSGMAPASLDCRRRRPFRAALSVGDVTLDIRMESWLPPDTMRRAGFGHVIANRTHVLTLERGVSVVTLTPAGRVVQAAYASGLFAPLRRHLVQRAAAGGKRQATSEF